MTIERIEVEGWLVLGAELRRLIPEERVARALASTFDGVVFPLVRASAAPVSTKPAKTTPEDFDRLYAADAPMADGETEMTAAENVLSWLIIEKIGCPDDRNYSPNEAQEILVRRLDHANKLEDAALRTSASVGKDQAGLMERVEKLEAWAHEPFDFTHLIKRLEALEAKASVQAG